MEILKYSEYFERKTHGTIDFPFAFYDVTQRHPQYNMPLHWHGECELIRVISGTFNLNINSSHILLNVGDYAFIASGLLHGGVPDNCHYQCIVFSADFLGRCLAVCTTQLQSLETNGSLLPRHYPASSERYAAPLRDIFEAMADAQSNPVCRLRAVGSLCRFLSLILEDGKYEHSAGVTLQVKRKIRQYKKILTFIEEHYPEKLTLDDLAGCVSMNKNYFCKFFYDLTQRSPMEYLNYYRIEAACEQLSHTDKSITEVALDCGFSDASYFIKVFKKYKGITPSRYEEQAGLEQPSE